METNEAIVHEIGPEQARVNVTWGRQNGNLPAPVSVYSTDEDIRQMVTEALRGGGIPGLEADPGADLTDYVVQKFDPTAVRPYNYITIRPKTPFGSELDVGVKRLIRLAHDKGVEKEDLVLQIVMTWEDLYEG